MQILENEIAKQAGYSLVELEWKDFEDRNNKYLNALISLYQQVFDIDAAGFSEDRHPYSLVEHVLKLQLDYPTNNGARMWAVTLPYDEKKHTPERGFLPVTINEKEQVFVSFMSAIAQVDADTFTQVVGYTASLFKPEDEARHIREQVETTAAEIDFKTKKHALVSEIASDKDSQDGIASLLLMVALREHLTKLGIDEYWMWTDKKGDDGKELPMYKIAIKRLGMIVRTVLSRDNNRILFNGIVSEGSEAIKKMINTISERFRKDEQLTT